MTMDNSESEPAPNNEIPQMHVQDIVNAINNQETSAEAKPKSKPPQFTDSTEEKKQDGETVDDDDIDNAMKEFQSTLKEVLSDEKGAEHTMQSME